MDRWELKRYEKEKQEIKNLLLNDPDIQDHLRKMLSQMLITDYHLQPSKFWSSWD
jgi:hypothetical protein